MAKITDIVGKNLALKALNIAASRLYQYFTHQKEEIANKINQYNIKDQLANVEGSIEDVAQIKGLERKLGGYNESLINRLKEYLAYLGHLANYLRYSSPTLESKQYVAAKTADDLRARLLGQTLYVPPNQNKVNYLSDIIRSDAATIGDTNYKLDKLLELGRDLYNKKSNILYEILREASRRTSIWVMNQVRELKGIESITSKRSLEHILGRFVTEAVGTLAEYRSLMRQKPVYYQDLRQDSYATV